MYDKIKKINQKKLAAFWKDGIMKKSLSRFICIVIICAVVASLYGCDIAQTSSDLTETQKNSIAMLNYLNLISQEINSSPELIVHVINE